MSYVEREQAQYEVLNIKYNMKPKPIRLFSRAAMLLLMMMLTATTAWAQSAIGSIQYNSTGGYYEIGSVDNLNDLAVYVNGTGTYSTGATETTAHNCGGLTFKMTANIAFSYDPNEDINNYDENFTAIGGYNNSFFWGEFNGDSHTVSGIRINNFYKDNQGLFGMTDGANIHDVHLTDARILGHDYVGGIVGNIWSGTISNCTVTESAITTTTLENDPYCGTICGYRFGGGGTLSHNYYYHCKVNGTANATNVGCKGADIATNDGAMPVFALTLGTGVTTTTTPTVSISGTDYYKSGATVTLSGNAPDGYRYDGYTASKTADGTDITATALSGSTLTMPDQDVTVSLALQPIDWAEESTGEDADHAYMIYNKDQLILLAYRVNGTHDETADEYGYSGKYFKLGADITFTYDPNEDIDNYEAIGGRHNNDDRYFRGNFDGAGYTVSGIRINKTGDDIDDRYIGLFGQIDRANIHDVHLTDARIKGYYCIGGIVGYNADGTVSNCTVTESEITATKSAITADHKYGTICGYNFDGTLSHNYYRYCKVNGTANATNVGCGGADITDNDGAMPMYVAYIDADGSEAKCFDYTELTGGDTQTLDGSTWYAVTDNIAYTGTLTLNANATIILADGKSLNIGTEDERISSGSCISSSKYGLTIYGQTKGDGTLNAYNSTSSSPVDVKSYTQHGGTVNVDGTGMHAIWLSGNLTLTRGSLNANGHDHEAIHVGSNTVNVSGGTLTATSTTVGINGYLTMSGGTVTATGYSGGTSSNGYGAISNNTTVSGGTLTANAPILGHVRLSGGTTTIYGNGFGAVYGDLTLSGTTTATVSGKVIGTTSRNVIIANGQAFTDGNGHYYTGTLSNDERNAISGKTLTRLTAIQLADAADNSAAIGKLNGITGLDITLQGRTLYKDGNWNTLCLPFDVTVGSGQLTDATAMTLNASQSGFDASTGVLTLNFDNVTLGNTIAAGTPFIVKWTGTDVTNPVFSGVTIDNSAEALARKTVTSTDSKVSFLGIYSPTNIYSASKDNLFLGIGKNDLNEDVSMLFWPSTTDYTLGAFRAYFHVDLTETNGVRDIVLNFDEQGTQNGIGHTDITDNTDKADAAWYSINGVKLDSKPSSKGIYIHGNRKVVIK